MKILVLLSLLLVASAVAFASVDPAAVDLRPQFEQGRTTRYAAWTQRDQVITMTVNQQTRTVSTRMLVEGEIDWTIQQVRPDGSATATMTMDWMTASVTLPDGSVQHNDSRRPRGDTEGVHQLIRAMSGSPVTVEVAADGSILSVRGTGPMRRKAPEGFPQDLDFIESASDLATIPHAPAPGSVAIGGSWDASFRWSHEMGHLLQNVRYTLAGLEEIEGVPLANVALSSRARLEVDRSKMPKDGPPVDVRLTEGGVTGQIMFDLSRGEAVGRNSVDRRVIDISVRLPQATIKRRIEETIQSQTLRIAE